MITIVHKIRHHDRNFSLVAEEWPDAADAARAIRWLRDWIEQQTSAQVGVLHFVIEARQQEPGARFRIIELDEVDEALRQARGAGLPFFSEDPPRARRMALRADAEEIEVS